MLWLVERRCNVLQLLKRHGAAGMVAAGVFVQRAAASETSVLCMMSVGASVQHVVADGTSVQRVAASET